MSESGSWVTITISPRMPWARATPPISTLESPRGTAASLFEDLDQRALPRAGRHRLHDGAQRASGLAAAADDFAEVRFSNLELVDVGLTLLDQLDANFVGLVDEIDREVADELRQVGLRRHRLAGLLSAG